MHDDTFSPTTTFQNFVLHAETIQSIVLLDGSGFVKTTPGKDKNNNIYKIKTIHIFNIYILFAEKVPTNNQQQQQHHDRSLT